MNLMNNDYIFSVIMAIYNNVDTVGDAIESIVNQTLGMDKIQLILISDGSTDGTDDICQQYANRFPNNVVFHHKENGGVSSARNMGLDFVSGKYVIFFDGDDSWDKNAFQIISRFFDKHYNDIDLCTCKIEYTGEKAGQRHPLDYKFDNGDRIVDLEDDPECICTTIGNSVFKSSCIQEQRFVPGLWLGEDATFNIETLLEKHKCGVISSAIFYYHMDITSSTASGGARNRESFYLEIPRDYYLRVIDMSKKKCDRVQDFIQHTILYDIRWRMGAFLRVEQFTDEQRNFYLNLMHEVLTYIDDRNIRKARGYNEYRKAYLMSLKYNKNLIESIDEKRGSKGYLYADNVFAFSSTCRSLINIGCFKIVGDFIRVDGYCRSIIFDNEYEVSVSDQDGNSYQITYADYPDTSNAYLGMIGEKLCIRRSFSVDIPATEGSVITFSITINGIECRLKPQFASWTGITFSNATYMVIGDWIVTRRKYGFALHYYSHANHFLVEARKEVELIKTLKPQYISTSMTSYHLQRLSRTVETKRQVAFVSNRKNNALEDNLVMVRDKLSDLPNVSYARMWPHTNTDRLRFAKAIYNSKVIVLDDYSYFLRNYGISSGHHVIQLWHACGAFKKFGQDGTNLLPAADRLYHCHYDMVSVSSEGIRSIYAHAFGIPEEKVKALGVPRTDVFFDSLYREEVRSSVYSALPQLLGKRVILYAPTFRDKPFPRNHFVPNLDFKRLSNSMPDNTILVLRPHPVMTDPIIDSSYDNILEVRDISTQDLMFVSDLLVTDYSSVIFEYSLLDKPMLFFCYDFDEYNRDFYLNYKTDLPGKLVKSQEDLFEALNDKSTFEGISSLSVLRNKYMGACDGHSTERIANYIRDLF